MFTFLLQDRVTVVLKGSTSALVQAEPEWLDLSGYQDVVFWTEVTEASAAGASPTRTLDFETPLEAAHA